MYTNLIEPLKKIDILTHIASIFKGFKFPILNWSYPVKESVVIFESKFLILINLALAVNKLMRETDL